MNAAIPKLRIKYRIGDKLGEIKTLYIKGETPADHLLMYDSDLYDAIRKNGEIIASRIE